MGAVYRAKDLRLGREVAVKVLPAEIASSPDRKEESGRSGGAWTHARSQNRGDHRLNGNSLIQ